MYFYKQAYYKRMKYFFKRGYNINLRGDTVNGYLLEQSSINASKKCIFKSNPDGKN